MYTFTFTFSASAEVLQFLGVIVVCATAVLLATILAVEGVAWMVMGEGDDDAKHHGA